MADRQAALHRVEQPFSFGSQSNFAMNSIE